MLPVSQYSHLQSDQGYVELDQTLLGNDLFAATSLQGARSLVACFFEHSFPGQ